MSSYLSEVVLVIIFFHYNEIFIVCSKGVAKILCVFQGVHLNGFFTKLVNFQKKGKIFKH